MYETGTCEEALSVDLFCFCVPAMVMLNGALLKVLQIYFNNFQSDFSSQRLMGKPQTYDVEANQDILQFTIASMYKLNMSWMKYVHSQTSKPFIHAHLELIMHKFSFCRFVWFTIIVPMKVFPFPVTWHTEKQRSVRPPSRRISAQPCHMETISDATACKGKNMSLNMNAIFFTAFVMFWVILKCRLILLLRIQI